LPDLLFNIRKVDPDLVSTAVRSAVFGPLMSRSIPLAGDPAWPFMYESLRSRWHNRIDYLQGGGWFDSQDSLRRQYMRNCPPVGAQFDDVSNNCNASRVCPFCYGRSRVQAPLQRLLPYLGKDKMVVSFLAVNRFPRLGPYASMIVAYVKADRAREARQIGGTGYVNQRISVDSQFVEIERRGVFVCPRGPKPFLTCTEVWCYRPTEENLCKAASRAFAYSPWFFNGRAREVVDFLKGLGKTKLLVGYGFKGDPESDGLGVSGRRGRPQRFLLD
jgi:hypothetical protein